MKRNPDKDLSEQTPSSVADDEAGSVQEDVSTEPKAKKSKRGAREKKVSKKELDLLNDQHIRLQADFENFKKRTLREKAEFTQRANEALILELLPALDHMDLALKAAMEQPDNREAILEGLKLLGEQVSGALRKFGLEPIEGDQGLFDPRIHEAVSHIPSEDYEANTIMTQLRRGYRLAGKVLRASQVVVSSGLIEPVPDSAVSVTDTALKDTEPEV